MQGPATLVNNPENCLISWEPLYLWHCQEAAHDSCSTHKCSNRLNIFLGFGDNIFFIKEFYLSEYMLLLANQPIWNGLHNKRLWNLSRWQHSGPPVVASPPTPRLLNCRGFSNLLSCLLECLDHPNCPPLSVDFWFCQLASWAPRCLPLDSEIWKQAHLGLSHNLLDCLSLQYLFLSPHKLFFLELHWNTFCMHSLSSVKDLRGTLYRIWNSFFLQLYSLFTAFKDLFHKFHPPQQPRIWVSAFLA